MKKIIIILVVCIFSASAFAKKTTYIYTDNRFNFVKIEEMGKKEVEDLAVNHPFTIAEDQLRAILKEIKLSRTFVMKKETETQDIFDERAINFLTPKIAQALSQATNKDKIIISYLTKDPKFILRDDRLTIVNIWAHGTELHFEFEKLLAKLSGDYDKRGDSSKVIARARGLRVHLAVRDGQVYGNGVDELVVDTTHDFAKAPTETSETTEIASTPGTPEVIEAPNQQPATTKDRLKELEDLKSDGLITEKEYKKKRKEILKGL